MAATAEATPALPAVRDPFAVQSAMGRRIPPGPAPESGLADPFASRRPSSPAAAPAPRPAPVQVRSLPAEPTARPAWWSRGLQDPFSSRGLERRNPPAPRPTTDPLRDPWR